MLDIKKVSIIITLNNTRPGYDLRITLKLAGYLFLPLKNYKDKG
tara:strand:+ start:7058 stop:7189 length:132 start_codon:yes stop_codon:yes gene_type:complete